MKLENGAKHASGRLGGRLCVLAGRDWNKLSLAHAGLNEMTEAEELQDHNPICDF